jgi:hypothetical protein
MAFAAFADTLRPGSADAVRDLLPSVSAPAGLLGLSAFLRGDTLIRVAEFEDKGTDAAALLAADPGTAARERALSPHLKDAGSDAWRVRAMERVQQRVVRPTPGAALSALWYDVVPGSARRIAETFADVVPQQRPMLRGADGSDAGVLHGVAVFVHGSAMVRVVSYTGDVRDVARYMATRPGRPVMEQRLAPFLAETLDGSSEDEFLRRFPERVMEPVRTGRH